MTRDNTLIQDPNSLFAISRSLRKSIVKYSQDAQDRNNAIRDEKHLLYRSTNRDGYEYYKYEILTSLDLLDNNILELETVLDKITDDEKTLEDSVAKKLLEESQIPVKPRGRPKGSKNKLKGKGFSGGAFSKNQNVIDEIKQQTGSRNFKSALSFLANQLSIIYSQQQMGMINPDDMAVTFSDIYNGLYYETPTFDGTGFTDEEEAILEEIKASVQDWINGLPNRTLPPLPKKAVPIVPSISVFSGNEFIISTLSKMNNLLTKLIAEYRGKILINYKNFLVSDIEEIGLKVIDSKRRFDDLKAYIDSFEGRIGKIPNISKFLRTIDSKFNEFLSLSARAVANFVNPNLVNLPVFSQQLLNPSPPSPKKTKARVILKKPRGFVEDFNTTIGDYRKFTELADKENANFEDLSTRIYTLERKASLTGDEEKNLARFQKQQAISSSKYATLIQQATKLGKKLRAFQANPLYETYRDDLNA